MPNNQFDDLIYICLFMIIKSYVFKSYLDILYRRYLLVSVLYVPSFVLFYFRIINIYITIMTTEMKV